VTCDVSVVESRCRRRFLVGDGGGGDDRRAEIGKAAETERSLSSRKNRCCSYNLLIARRYNDNNYLE